jgi:putative peptidoglycan lipid II flippase
MNDRKTAHPTALLVSTTVAYYLLDLIKRIFLYAYFGPQQLDAYVASYSLMEAAVNATMFTALAAVMMPTLAAAEREGGVELAERYGSTVLLLSTVLLAGTAVAGMVFAPELLALYGFTATPAGLIVVRLVFAVLPCFGAEKILRQMLEQRGRFGPPVAASLVQRVVFLVVVIALAATADLMAAGVAALAAGVAAAGFLLLAHRRIGGRLRAPLGLRSPWVRRTGALLLPLGIAGFFAQAPLVDGLFASYFGRGSLSLLQLAVGVYTIPIALFCISVGTAAFPRMCASAAEGDLPALQRHIAVAVRRSQYFLLPSMFGVVVLARPLIRVAFQHGEFSPFYTPITANCLVAYALGLAALGMRPILARAIYAVNRFRWFVAVELVTLALNVAFNLLFAVQFGWGIVGLALSTSLASFITTAMLWGLTARFIGVDRMRGLVSSLVRMAACAALMGAAVYGMWALAASFAEDGPWTLAASLGGCVATGAGLYFLATAVAGIEEFADLRGLFDKLIRRARG